jgi:hypothetical protein
MAAASSTVSAVSANMDRSVLGHEDVKRGVLLALLAREHGAHFRIGFCSSGVPPSDMPLLRLKRCHACVPAQTPLGCVCSALPPPPPIVWHPNTAGTFTH